MKKGCGGVIPRSFYFFTSMSVDNNIIQSNIWDTLLEMPIEYKAGENVFYLYPPSLGCSLLINRYAERFNNEEILYYTLAICSFENRADARKNTFLKQRVEQLRKVSIEELMPIYTMFIAWGQDQDRFIKHFQLDVEQRYMKRAQDAKDNDSSSLVFNGKSIYGALVDLVCERYGWTMDYLIWGISLINLNMLMTDKVVSVFLTKEESMRAAVPKNRNITKVDKNTSKEQLLAFLKG